jgi:hypothetical protein
VRQVVGERGADDGPRLRRSPHADCDRTNRKYRDATRNGCPSKSEGGNRPRPADHCVAAGHHRGRTRSTGRPFSRSTIARRFSFVAGWAVEGLGQLAYDKALPPRTPPIRAWATCCSSPPLRLFTAPGRSSSFSSRWVAELLSLPRGLGIRGVRATGVERIGGNAVVGRRESVLRGSAALSNRR